MSLGSRNSMYSAQSHKFRNTGLGCVCYGDLLQRKGGQEPRIALLKGKAGKVISQGFLSKATSPRHTDKIRGQPGATLPVFVLILIPQTSEEILQIYDSKRNEYKLQRLQSYTLIILNCNSREIRQETGPEDV